MPILQLTTLYFSSACGCGGIPPGTLFACAGRTMTDVLSTSNDLGAKVVPVLRGHLPALAPLPTRAELFCVGVCFTRCGRPAKGLPEAHAVPAVPAAERFLVAHKLACPIVQIPVSRRHCVNLTEPQALGP